MFLQQVAADPRSEAGTGFAHAFFARGHGAAPVARRGVSLWPAPIARRRRA